jgi:hypothetical protein
VKNRENCESVFVHQKPCNPSLGINSSGKNIEIRTKIANRWDGEKSEGNRAFPNEMQYKHLRGLRGKYNRTNN